MTQGKPENDGRLSSAVQYWKMTKGARSLTLKWRQEVAEAFAAGAGLEHFKQAADASRLDIAPWELKTAILNIAGIGGATSADDIGVGRKRLTPEETYRLAKRLAGGPR